MSGMQKAVVKNMAWASSVPTYTVSRQIVTDEFDALYAQLKPKVGLGAKGDWGQAQTLEDLGRESWEWGGGRGGGGLGQAQAIVGWAGRVRRMQLRGREEGGGGGRAQAEGYNTRVGQGG
jgi:hypothetical protein